MKTKSASRAAYFNLRVLIGFALCSVSLLRASAQIGGGGTTNYIPLWTSSSGLGNSHIYQSGLRLGIGTTSPQGALDVRDASDLFTIRGTNLRVGGIGVSGVSTNPTGFGVTGLNIATTGQALGLLGVTDSNAGVAIKGVAVHASVTSNDLPELPVGVLGDTHISNGVGVAGTADHGIGVMGLNAAGDAAAGFFQNHIISGSAPGVEGQTLSTAGRGVYGWAKSTTGSTFGVYGQSDSTAGIGVYGISTAPTAGGGYPVGVQGNSTHGTGVSGISTEETGVVGSSNGNGNGVAGLVNGSGVGGYFANSGSGYVLVGVATVGGPNMFTVDGAGNGFFAGNLQVNNGSSNLAGPVTVSGDLTVNGTLHKSGGSFKIDHPLDPANKYLSHSFVESPDMMNVYNGNITTDENGLATVVLPDYFEALNRDFRYQLTVIGQFAQAMVAEEISHNHFTIRTSQPSVKVSWQVTGVRQDAWANAHRIPTEEDKPAEKRGTYLHPELYGASTDKNTDAIVQH